MEQPKERSGPAAGKETPGRGTKRARRTPERFRSSATSPAPGKTADRRAMEQETKRAPPVGGPAPRETADRRAMEQDTKCAPPAGGPAPIETVGSDKTAPAKKCILLVGGPKSGKTTIIEAARGAFAAPADSKRMFTDDVEYAEFDTFVLTATTTDSRVARDELALDHRGLHVQRSPLQPLGNPMGIRVGTEMALPVLRGSTAEGFFECDPTNTAQVKAMVEQLLA
jgi:hypothetical protein